MSRAEEPNVTLTFESSEIPLNGLSVLLLLFSETRRNAIKGKRGIFRKKHFFFKISILDFQMWHDIFSMYFSML